MDMAHARLTAYGRQVTSPFGLLGQDENALSFALGYTFAQCPNLLHAFLKDIGLRGLRHAALKHCSLLLQEHGSKRGLTGITDLELHLPGCFHVIVEAKVGLSTPTVEQCVKYLPRFQEKNEPTKRLVALLQISQSFSERYYRASPSLKELLIPYTWTSLIPHCIHDQRWCPQTTLPGYWVRSFQRFLEEEYNMKCFTEEVWIVSASQVPLWPNGLSHYDTHVKGRIYYRQDRHTKRPLYLALRTQGRIEALQRVLRVEHEVQPVNCIPALKNVPHGWPSEPHTIWHLGEPVKLPNPIPTDDAAMRGRMVSCDLDILLSSSSIKQAVARMQKRSRRE
jgi:hypothetical protein